MGKIIYQRDSDGNIVYPVTVGDAIAVNGETLTSKVNKLDTIEEGAQKNVQPDWNATEGNTAIKNKPVIPDPVTETTISDWGFTKNTGNYNKPVDGISKDDLNSNIQSSLNKADTAIQPNSDIIGDTKCKITYDAKGLVTGGSDLAISDIPSLPASKITNGSFEDERIASASKWNGKQDALSFTSTPSSTNKVVTKQELDAAIAGASNYLGTISSISDLSTSAKKGDFYRVSDAWVDVHVGDIIIAEKDSPSKSIDGTNWTLLHNELNTDTHDTNNAGTGIDVSGTRGNTISISSSYQSKIANGETAYGWGNHASAGYLKSVDWSQIISKPSFATVATSGKYSDLSGLPTIPTSLPANGGWSDSANVLSTYTAPGSGNITALQNIFNSIPKSVATAVRTEHGCHSMAFGWFLDGYDFDNAYGGWFISDYGTPTWVGVTDGQWNERSFIMSDDYRLSDARPASDVYDWAKATVKPSYDWSEITGKPTSFSRFSKQLLTESDNLDSISDGIYYHANLNTPTNHYSNNSSVIQFSGRHDHEKFQFEISTNDKRIGFRACDYYLSWDNWKTLAFLDDIPTDTSQLTNGAGFVTTDHTYNFEGVSFCSGNGGYGEHDANSIITNGHYYYTANGPSTDLGASTGDGALYVQAYSDVWAAQIAQDYRNGRLFVRGKNNGVWQSWNRIAQTGEAQPASDVYAWAKASVKPSYDWSEINNKPTFNSSGSVTSVSGIPVNNNLVIATISSSSSFSLASVPAAGKEVHVIIFNNSSSSITIAIPNSGSYANCGEDTIDIEASSYGEINTISDGSKIYLRGASK